MLSMAMKLALFVCFITTFISSSSFSSAAATTTTTSGTINWWCGQTPHYETCDHYIGQRNTTNTPISMIEFLEMSVRVTINHAGEVLKRVKAVEAKYPNVPGKSLWSSCVDYFDGLIFTLNMILDKDHTPLPTPLDIQTRLSAGLAYIDLCGYGFELIKMNNTILPTISTNLTELIHNSLAISVLYRGSSRTPGVLDSNFPNEFNLSGLGLDQTPNVVVAQDGSGDYTTVQEGVDSAVNRKHGRYVIYVKAGEYQEKVVVPKKQPYITMYGDGIDQTIISYDNHAGGNMSGTIWAGDLKATATFQSWGGEFVARDMTFRNTAGPEGGQALALYVNGHKSVFYRCSIEGYQDTLLAHLHQQFYKECQILGTVDFVCGDGQVVFQDCEILFRKPRPGGGLVVAAQSRSHHNESSGFSFQGCNVTGAEDISGSNKAFLGRPWRRDAVTVFMESFLDEWIDPLGWLDSWNYSQNSFCGEYNNDGPGSATDQRVNWFKDITDPNEAKSYTVAGFMSGDQWLPEDGVPFIAGLEKQTTK